LPLPPWWEAKTVDKCAILYIDPRARAANPHVRALRSLGFSVDVAADIPAADVCTRYHVVAVRTYVGCHLANLGMRMRAKPRFGRRVLIALADGTVSDAALRDATANGFDLVLPALCTARDLAAHILRKLRGFPEFRCLLRAPNGRRKAA
jgi:hypothetical protein